MYDGNYTESDFKEWITAAESNWNKVKADYEEDREYFENMQAPSDVPDDKEFITENRITDLVRRLTGAMISGKVNIECRGGGKMSDPLKILMQDILRENNFRESLVENITNHFYCEGYAGWKYRYNPMRLSKYGLGKPEIFALDPDQLWLDPNARDMMHSDDIFRIHPQRILLSYAKERWPKFADKITESMSEVGTGDETEEFCDLYEIEFRETFFQSIASKVLDEQGKKKSIRIEHERYYIVLIINKAVIVEGPQPTGYPDFRMGPFIHTPRKDVGKGKMPFGPVRLTAQTQNQKNILASIMQDIVKKDIKKLAIIAGGTVEDEVKYKQEASKEHGVLVLSSPDARVMFAPQTGLAPSLLQMKEMIDHRFDEATGKYAPQRGDIQGQLSGKAIAYLNSGGIESEYVAQNHLESGFTALARAIYHSIKNELNQPFKVFTEIDGKEREIYYNSDVGPDDDYHVPGPRVYELSGINMEVYAEVIMNSLQMEQAEQNKALVAYGQGLLAKIDTIKALYPKSYAEKYDNLLAQDQAMQLMNTMMQQGPEFMSTMGQIIQQGAQQIETARTAKDDMIKEGAAQ